MPRHLLPKNRGDLPTPQSGNWTDFTANFPNFHSQIDVGSSKINITSIPSPWARMLLFKEAIKDVKHAMHMEVMSHILDVLEIIFYQKMLNFQLSEVEVSLNDSTQDTAFIKKLWDLAPDSSFSQISLLVCNTHKKGKFVFAGTSPYTLFFTPRDIKGTLNRYFHEEPVPLRNRPMEFQRFIKNVFLHELKACLGGTYSDLINAFAFPEGICKDSNNESLKTTYISSGLLQNQAEISKVLFSSGINQIESKNLLKPTKSIELPPMIINATCNLEGRPYFNRYTFSNGISLDSIKNMDREVLPGEEIRYPWISPYHDLLEPIMIKYKYNLCDEHLVMGKNTTAKKYALPLSMKFFDYFTTQDVDKYVSLSAGAGSTIKVKLTLPLADGSEIDIERTYSEANSGTDQVNRILNYDEKGTDTPLPHFSFWPKLHPQVWKAAESSKFWPKLEGTGDEVAPYYGFSYGKSDEFLLEFLDEKGTHIHTRSSIKSGHVTTYRMDDLPVIIKLIYKNKNHGLLILDHIPLDKPTLNITDTAVGIDFGTSHTNIAIRVGDNTNILQYSSKYSGKNQNSKDFITFTEFPDDIVKQDDLPRLIIPTISQYFMPNVLGSISDERSISLPLPSFVVNEESGSFEALIKTSVNFSKNLYYDYTAEGKEISKKYQEVTDLKWSNESFKQNATKEFLRILLLIVRYELLKRNAAPDKVKFYWAYPKSFGEQQISSYRIMWESLVPREQVTDCDESKAALLYFSQRKELPLNNPKLTCVIDIGGGSSDVSIWHNSEILVLYSSLWAGKQLVGYKNDSIYSEIYDQVMAKYHEISKSFANINDFYTQLNYILSCVNSNDLSKLTQTSDFWVSRFILIYFYSALFYEVGLQCRNLLKEQARGMDICLAGNGSRFISWSSGCQDRIHQSEQEFYSKILRDSMGYGDNLGINFVLSKEFKTEVSIGLCSKEENLRNRSALNNASLAENLIVSSENSQGEKWKKETDTEVFNKEYCTQKDKGIVFEIPKDFSTLYKFNDSFFNLIANTSLYKEQLRSVDKLKDLQKIKEALVGDWDSVTGSLRDSVNNNLNNYGSVSSSIFILGMQTLIKRLHKHLSAK